MNWMDDNLPDICKSCGYIISPQEDSEEDICEKCRDNQRRQAIVDASVKMYRFNEESRKVLSTATSPTHKTLLVRDRTEQERQNYQEWEAAVRDWEAK